MKMSRCLVLLSMVAGGVAGLAPAGPLTGSGSHLPMPSPNPGAPTCVPSVLSAIVHPTSFTGTWSPPAAPPWVGSFSATGPVPSSANAGTTRYDFAGLTAGNLPAGTLFQFGDLDDGSGGEILTLEAFDASGLTITAPWLDTPSHVWGTGYLGGAPASIDLPSWSFSAGVYTLDGGTVPANPNVAFVLPSNTAISKLTLVKARVGNGMSLCAPLPAPGSLALLGAAGLVAARRRR